MFANCHYVVNAEMLNSEGHEAAPILVIIRHVSHVQRENSSPEKGGGRCQNSVVIYCKPNPKQPLLRRTINATLLFCVQP